MTRPLLIIFLTIFVNLIGFGIIIPLLPFYAETFQASQLTIGLLFGIFSICQLIAGFWIWKVKSMDEALEWVKRCPNPHVGDSDIEIRPFFEPEDFA